jgi:Ubiquitin fusion degradation protein UFD1
MMKTLRLNEGDPIRVTGAQLPKGKFIKLQAQTVDFIEVSDPKAVYVSQALQTRDRLALAPLSSDTLLIALNKHYETLHVSPRAI